MANEGIALEVYRFDDPSKVISVIPLREEPKFLDELQAVGAGSFQVNPNDPKIVRNPKLLDYLNIIKVRVNGTIRGAFVVQVKNDIPITEGETRPPIVQVSGEGVLSLFNQAEVYPAKGVQAYSSDDRSFNFSTEPGAWYNAADWKVPYNVVKWGDVVPSNYRFMPSEWPDVPNAYWIWPTNQLTTENAYFRHVFNVTEVGDYSLFFAADDGYDVYLDGANLGGDAPNPDLKRVTQRIDMKDLQPGSHTLGIHVRNTGGPGALLAALFRSGNAEAQTPATLVSYTGQNTWRGLTDPSPMPGWSVGEILLTLIDEAKARGVRSMNWFEPTFTATTDSKGAPWVVELDWTFPVGRKYWDVMEQLQELACEIWVDTSVFPFKLHAAPTNSVDRSAQVGTVPPVVLREGLNLKAASEDGQADLTNVLLVKSNDGWHEQLDQSGSRSVYGRIEGSFEVGGSKALATALANKAFEIAANPVQGASYELIPVDGAVPFVDFQKGDWVLAPSSRGSTEMTRRRVMSIAVTEDDAGNPQYDVEFDTIFQDSEKRLEKWVSRGGGGGSLGGSLNNAGGGAPSLPTPFIPLIVYPKAPTNLTASSSATWTMDGVAVAQTDLYWDQVTQSTDGGVLSPGAYEVWGYRDTREDELRRLLVVTNPSATLQNQTPGDVWTYAVRAMTPAGTPGEFARFGPITVPAPVAKPPIPTTPTVTQKLSVVSVAWNGLLGDPALPPQAYIKSIYTEMSTSETGTYDVVGQTFVGEPGLTVIPELEIGTTYWFRLRSTDRVGNISDPSPAVSITVEGLTLPDVSGEIADAINEAKADSSKALDDASKAVTAANGKNKVYYSSTTPVPPTGITLQAGDTWFNTGDGNKISVYDGTNWVLRDFGASALAAGAVTEGKLAADAVTNDKLAAAVRNAITTAQTTATNAQTAANGKNTVYYAASAPTGGTYRDGDVWFDSANNNRISIRSGSSWVLRELGAAALASGAVTEAKIASNAITVNKIADGAIAEAKLAANAVSNDKLATAVQTAITTAQSTATNAQTTANGKNTVYYAASAPTGGTYRDGDIWFDSANNNRISTRSGTSWVLREFGAAALASGSVTEAKIASNAITVNKVADGAIATAKIAANAVDTTKLATAVTNSISQAQSDATAAGTAASNAQTAAGNAQTAANTANQNALEAAGIANGKGKVIYQSSAPTGSNAVETNLWIRTTDNKPHTYNGSAWVAVESKVATDAASAAATAQTRADNAFTEATNAATAAGQAQTTANGKNRSWYQDTAPAGTLHTTGDIWFQTNQGNRMYSWLNNTWTLEEFGNAAIANLAITNAKIADATILNAKIATLDAAKVTTGTLSADRIGANSITAAKIAALTITAAELAANSIIAGKIAANAVTAGTVAADAITTRELAANSVTATQLVAGTITAASGIIANAAIGTAQIQDAAITNAKVANLDAAKITTGTLDANRISARSITAEKLILGDLSNIAPDPLLEYGNAQWDGTIVSVTGATGALNALRVTSHGPNTFPGVYSKNWAPVNPGDQFYFSAESQNGTGGIATVRLQFADKNKANPTYFGSSSTGNTWGTISGKATAPSSAAFVRMWVEVAGGTSGQNAWFTNFLLRRMASAELIVDGAVTADKVAANAVTADKIVASTITGDKLAVNAITTRELAANSVTATQLVAGTITAASGIIANAAVGTAQIADAAITNAKIANLDAAKITTGTLDANRIGTNTIEARHITIADFTNLATISELVPNSMLDAQSGGNVHGSETVIDSGYIRRVSTAGSFFMFTYQRGPVPFEPSEQLLFDFDAYVVGGTTPLNVTPTVWWYGSAGGSATGPVAALTGSVQSFERTVATGAFARGTTTSFIIGLQGVAGRDVRVRNVVVRRMNGGNLIVDGAVTADKVAANAITAAKMVAGTITAASGILASASVGTATIADAAVTNAKISNLDAAKITTGTLDAQRIAANSISVEKLLVANLTNLIQDPGFESNSTRAWTLGTGSSIQTGAQGRSGSYYLAIAPTSSARESARNPIFSVSPGEEYFYSAWVRPSATGAPANAIELSVLRGATPTSVTTATAVGSSPTGMAPSDLTEITGVWTVPENTYFVAPRIVVRDTANSRTFYVDDVEFRLRSGARLIVDGSVSADKIAANAITATKIAANAITADKIQAGAVTAEAIAANAITAAKIDSQAINGMVITGATLRTAASGQRLQFDQDGFKAYDGSNIVTANLTATSGSFLVTGQNAGIGVSGVGAQNTEASATLGLDAIYFSERTTSLIDPLQPYFSRQDRGYKSEVWGTFVPGGSQYAALRTGIDLPSFRTSSEDPIRREGYVESLYTPLRLSSYSGVFANMGGFRTLLSNRGSATARDQAYPPNPSSSESLARQGERFFNTDVGRWEQWYAVRSSSNPFGASAQGWVADETALITVNSVGSGFSLNSPRLTYRRVNGWAYLTGTVGRNNGTATGTVFTLQDGFRPTGTHYSYSQASGVIRSEVYVQPDGRVEIVNNVNNASAVAITTSWPVVL